MDEKDRTIAALQAERDELLRAAANIGIEGLADHEGLFDKSTAGAVTRSAAALMAAAVRLHGARIATGIAVDVDIDGRNLEVVAQWSDAPARTNAVAFACDTFRSVCEVAERTGVARGVAEQPMDWLARSVGLVMAERAAMRARVQIDETDLSEADIADGIDDPCVATWMCANGFEIQQPNPYYNTISRNGVAVHIGEDDNLVNALAFAVGRPPLDVLDEIKAMQVDSEAGA